MYTTLEDMKALGIHSDSKTYALVLERPLQNENVEMIVQGMAEMLSLGITPELDTAQRAIIIATRYGLPKLALELAHAFEFDSVRRLDSQVWLSCLICSAENLYVCPRTHLSSSPHLEHYYRPTVSSNPGKR